VVSGRARIERTQNPARIPLALRYARAMVKLRRFLGTASCALILSGCAVSDAVETEKAATTTTANSSRIAEIEQLVRQTVTDGKAAGISYGIQIADAPAVTREYGLADVSAGRKLVPGDRFRIASVTKPMTAVAVLRLVELGKLSLSDPVARFFPDYPNGQNISIYHLLSHTSGIPNWWDGVLPADTPTDFPMGAQPHRYLRAMKTAALFPPGSQYSYSNSGYVLLGEIIEIASGRSYEAFLAQNVFKPAGMNDTELEHVGQSSARWVSGYALDPAKPGIFTPPETYAMPFAAGGLRSTVADLLKFSRALRKGILLKPNSVTNMTTCARLADGRPVYEGKYSPPNSPPPRSRPHVAKNGYGFGFNVMELHGTPVYYHSGGIAGFNSYLIHIPKSRTTIALIANTENGIVPPLDAVLKIAVEIE
jgi:CubicO group peptidase (beta-lactamase class C family)